MSNNPLRRKLYELLLSPRLKPWLEDLPLIRRIYDGWRRVHPFDIAHGVDTSGFVSAGDCSADQALAANISPYVGSQPSIIRAVLATLPEPESYAFVDIGCGKGRPLIVASEFPYRRVLGVDLSPELAVVARANAAAISARYPDRSAIDIQVGDACAVRAPADRVVYYMYHAFNRSLVDALIANVERQIVDGLDHVFFVYYDPVHSAAFDASPHFARWSAQMIEYDAEEMGYGPDLADAVVVWQSRPERYPARAGAERAVVADHRNWCTLAGAAPRGQPRPLLDPV